MNNVAKRSDTDSICISILISILALFPSFKYWLQIFLRGFDCLISPTSCATTQVRMLYVGRLDNGMDQSLDTELAAAKRRLEAGWIRFIRAPKARLVFEEVSLVHVLVEHRIVLLPPSPSRRSAAR